MLESYSFVVCCEVALGIFKNMEDAARSVEETDDQMFCEVKSDLYRKYTSPHYVSPFTIVVVRNPSEVGSLAK